MDILDEINPYQTFLSHNLSKIYPIKHFCFYGTSIKNIMNVHLVKMQIFEREMGFKLAFWQNAIGHRYKCIKYKMLTNQEMFNQDLFFPYS